MKKTLFLAALVLISTGCFAQKNPLVKKAKNYAMASENPDFAAARAAISEALEAEPTAENFYWAGMIGYQELMQENYNQMMGKGVDQDKAGEAVEESYRYWLKADELAMIPTLDKKGREVVDTKTRNNINKKMLEYYKNLELIKYGAYLGEKKSYEDAYHAFMLHLQIPELPMMQSDKLQREMPRDSSYNLYKYYAGAYAVQAELHQEAVALLAEIKDGEIDPVFVNKLLFQEYLVIKDTAAGVAVLRDAIVRFPDDEWFVQSFVNVAIQTGREQEAVDYFTSLIERNPTDVLYYQKRGLMNELLERFDEAMADFDKAIELDPNNADAYAGKGRLFYNKAAKMNEVANDIMDNKKFQKAFEEVQAVFRQSMPYFEKAHELDPTRESFLQTLKTLYYRFRSEPGMQEKYDATTQLLESL
ncbi:MAG: tetratricopeptide repeat protein [Paludibacteraceae bacterium]|nr:tetratricopeptide repeat protein [Paludibacteraceae bacterium]